jgi:hypothetical protein
MQQFCGFFPSTEGGLEIPSASPYQLDAINVVSRGPSQQSSAPVADSERKNSKNKAIKRSNSVDFSLSAVLGRFQSDLEILWTIARGKPKQSH